jgi:diacylglycerol kinase family enzyme
MQLESKSKAAVDDGFFNVLLIDYVPSIFETPDLVTTILQSDRHIYRYRSDHMGLDFEDDVIWTLDGEEAKAKGHVEITIQNKALRILA